MNSTSPQAPDEQQDRLDATAAAATVTGLVMVYDADGGVRGELSYVWGKLRRTAHCSLCSITHGLTRERRSWTNWRDGAPVPITVLHRNECDADVEALFDQVQVGVPVLITTGVTAPAPTPGTYVVRAGDTLFLIAQRFGTTVDAIRRAGDDYG